MIAVLASLAFVLTGPTAPTPAEGEPRPRFAVDYDDLNLKRAKHVETLLQRMDAAASKACGVREDGLNAACRAAAVGQAVKLINAPRLTAAHQARTILAAKAS